MNGSLQQTSSSDQTTLTRTFVVENKLGIHARPAAMIVRVANKFSDVNIFVSKDKDKKEINARSIMGLMMLAAGPGSQLHFTLSGPDAKPLLSELESLFERKFMES